MNFLDILISLYLYRSLFSGKVLNIACLFLSLLAFVGCCVGFGADLFRAKILIKGGATANWTFYQYFIKTEATHINYSDSVACYMPFCSACKESGQAFLAFLVLAFLVLIALMCVTTFRIFGGVAISAIAHPARSILVESWAALIAAMFYLLATIIFGASCFTKTKNVENITLTMTGFAYIIFSCLMTIIVVILFYFIRRDERCHLGSVNQSMESLNEQYIRDDGDASQSYQHVTDIHSQPSYGSHSAPSTDAFNTQKMRGQR